MRKLLQTGMAFALLACAGAVFAYPTLMGQTGMAILPTGQIAAYMFTAAADYQKQEKGQGYPLRALVGIGSTAEIGGAYEKYDSASSLNNSWDVNAKLKLLHFLNGNIAIGGLYAQEQNLAMARTNYTQGYLAWSPGFNLGVAAIRVTVGANWTWAQGDAGADIDPGVITNGGRVNAGCDVKLLDCLDLIGEFQTKNSGLGDANPLTAFTVRYAFLHYFALQAGTTNMFNLHTTGSQHIFAGVEAGI